jgi:hypothetical protein
MACVECSYTAQMLLCVLSRAAYKALPRPGSPGERKAPASVQGSARIRYIGQGEARHRKYKRLQLGGGHVYDRSFV